ncbi:hypothetical protein [Citrobacter sp. CK180]|uniref:hypothetical protein n=1 Tax=Citrobacter sp. CK180 TaxID=2985089 RepID=UPI0025749785|nr:hypothetical protein [Citrobacter sp. CK180]MDM3064356.1 hypothetical protein [Citrobacter sp. CK180]
MKRNQNFYSPYGEGFVQPKFSAVQRAYNTEKLTMTTSKNVTELQPRMTREQLIDAARTAAKYLPVASAQIMNELANRLDCTSVALCEAMEQRKSLAIENTVLREDVTSWAKECDRIVERYTKTRSNMHLLEAQRELRDLTPATSAFLAEVRAHARNELIDELEARFTELAQTSPTPELQSGAAGAAGFVSTFRKGVQS